VGGFEGDGGLGFDGGRTRRRVAVDEKMGGLKLAVGN
jgi:hypothetical protein